MEIKVPCGIGERVYTPDQLRSEIEDLDFLRDAFLVLLNPEVAEKNWDIPFTRDEVIQYAREMYNELDYNPEFISKIFES